MNLTRTELRTIRQTTNQYRAMKATDKIIDGSIVRKNPEHKGMWDIMETRAGQLTGKASFTGTMKEVRDAIKEGNRIAKATAR